MYIILVYYTQVVSILTGLNSALCCKKQSELYIDRQLERLQFLCRHIEVVSILTGLNSALCCKKAE